MYKELEEIVKHLNLALYDMDRSDIVKAKNLAEKLLGEKEDGAVKKYCVKCHGPFLDSPNYPWPMPQDGLCPTCYWKENL